MNPNLLLRRPAALAALLLLAGPALAQPKPTPAPERRDPYEISIDFPGGPLSELVAQLAQSKETRLSIIQSEKLDPTLPAFSVQNARVDAVVSALGQILATQGYLLHNTGPNLAVLTKIESARDSRAQFTVLPLEKRLGNRPADELINAIQIGCEFASQDKSSLRFKYHPGTKLLYVSGSAQDIEVAHKIFSNLPVIESPTPTPPAEPRK